MTAARGKEKGKRKPWRAATHVRKKIVTGLLLLFPFVLTIMILKFIFGLLDGFLGQYFTRFLPRRIPGLGIISTFILAYFLGLIGSNIIGRRIVGLGERIFVKVPVARGIYSSAKQLVNTFSSSNSNSFKRVILLEYPRLGLYTLGFITREGFGEVQEKTREHVVNVFIPTTPNPTSGYLIMVPKDKVIPLDMSVEDGIRIIVSGGIASPEETDLLPFTDL